MPGGGGRRSEQLAGRILGELKPPAPVSDDTERDELPAVPARRVSGHDVIEKLPDVLRFYGVADDLRHDPDEQRRAKRVLAEYASGALDSLAELANLFAMLTAAASKSGVPSTLSGLARFVRVSERRDV